MGSLRAPQKNKHCPFLYKQVPNLSLKKSKRVFLDFAYIFLGTLEVPKGSIDKIQTPDDIFRVPWYPQTLSVLYKQVPNFKLYKSKQGTLRFCFNFLGTLGDPKGSTATPLYIMTKHYLGVPLITVCP